jgi:hypothetical protein
MHLFKQRLQSVTVAISGRHALLESLLFTGETPTSSTKLSEINMKEKVGSSPLLDYQYWIFISKMIILPTIYQFRSKSWQRKGT